MYLQCLVILLALNILCLLSICLLSRFSLYSALLLIRLDFIWIIGVKFLKGGIVLGNMGLKKVNRAMMLFFLNVLLAFRGCSQMM